ncbi:MAG: GntR family transcriptional regulator [Clostridium sp.]|uniref:GntR family transcriptional regulator n=1 Tax=Clostridium sp. TaxID=1506 RepID=UPI003D6DA12F
MKKEFNDRSPIYLQIIDIIKMNIVIGKLKSKDKLPSVREMALKFNVNPNTIQRSYQELERLGIVYIQRGLGTFVGEEKDMVNDLKREMAKEVIDSFILRMKSLGFSDNEIIKSVSKETLGVKENG